MSKNLNDKCIKATLRNNDFTKVKVEFSNGYWTPEQFTCVFMAILESYTLGLLETNKREDVYKHFNNAFGTFLAKILSEEEIYKVSDKHKELKDVVDNTLSREETEEDKKATEDNRFAAYLLCLDILTKEVGLTEDSANTLLAKRLGMYELLPPEAKEGKTNGKGRKKKEKSA